MIFDDPTPWIGLAAVILTWTAGVEVLNKLREDKYEKIKPKHGPTERLKRLYVSGQIDAEEFERRLPTALREEYGWDIEKPRRASDQIQQAVETGMRMRSGQTIALPSERFTVERQGHDHVVYLDDQLHEIEKRS